MIAAVPCIGVFSQVNIDESLYLVSHRQPFDVSSRT